MRKELTSKEKKSLHDASDILADLANDLEEHNKDIVVTGYSEVSFDELVLTSNLLEDIAEGPVEILSAEELMSKSK